MQKDEALDALETMRATQAKLASLGDCPPWRHAAFGGVMSLMILGAGFSLPLQIGLLVLSMGAMVLIVRSDRRRYGVFVNGYRKGATLPLTIVLLVVMLGLLVVQIVLKARGAPIWVPFAIAALAFVLGVGASLWWNRIFKREMTRGRPEHSA